MLKQIPFPAKCSDQQLQEVLHGEGEALFDFPYDAHRNRVLTIEDYQKEEADRRKKSEEELSPAELVVKRLREFAPNLHDEILNTANKCKLADKPVKMAPGLFSTTHMLYVAHMAIRASVRKSLGCTLVGLVGGDFWLLPQGVDARDWVYKKGGFDDPSNLKKYFPEAFAALESLAGQAKGTRDHFAVTSINNADRLNEIAQVLGVYTRYYPLEELHRVSFAMGCGNQVIAKTLYDRPDPYLAFISPENQLRIWDEWV